MTKTDAGLSYDAYQGGGGALDKSFWPASSIKVLAAVGALEYLNKQGFTGAASVTFADTGITRTVRSIYDAALRDSSKTDYDLLVEIAGVDWLNKEFLAPARGFPATVIQISCTGGDFTSSPAMSLAESTRKLALPARIGHFDNDCPPGGRRGSVGPGRRRRADQRPSRRRRLLRSRCCPGPGKRRACLQQARVRTQPGLRRRHPHRG